MKQLENPTWWDASYDSAWDRVKAALQRDWDQTKQHFGGDEPDTDQSVGNTIAQATGKEPIPPRGVPTFDEVESAYRFGYGARKKYGPRYPVWDERLEAELERDWDALTPDERDGWSHRRAAIRRGWDYQDLNR